MPCSKRLTEAADRMLAGLDDGSVEPAAIALADALDECISVLPDSHDSAAAPNRFAAVLELISQSAVPLDQLARFLLSACEQAAGEGIDPKADPAVRVLYQHLVRAFSSTTEEDDYVAALQHCADQCRALS